MPANPSRPEPEVADHEWLPENPPPQVIRLAGWVVILLFVCAVIAAVLIRLPETVRCRFTLIPSTGADPLQAPLSGVIERVGAVEGQEVAAGAVLFEIRSEEIVNWQTLLAAAIEDTRATEERSTRSEEAHKSLVQIKTAGIKQVEEERGFRERHRDTVKDLVSRSRKLKDDGLISHVELLRAELELAGVEKDLIVVEQSLQKAVLERTQLETERLLQRSEEQAALHKLKGTIAGLRLRLENCEGSVMRIRAPYPAVVVAVPQRNAGSTVQPGQQLAQLAPTGVALLAEFQLREPGLDQVARGQPARLHFDAFPYQRYGALPAQIDWVSASAVRDDREAGFRARATLAATTFAVQGSPLAVKAGMSGEARIRVGERTLIEYVFEPLKALREQMR